MHMNHTHTAQPEDNCMDSMSSELFCHQQHRSKGARQMESHIVTCCDAGVCCVSAAACCPIGNGKTLMARAVAGESGVAFISSSASEFIEMYMGLGAARVRDLFNTVRTTGPRYLSSCCFPFRAKCCNIACNLSPCATCMLSPSLRQTWRVF
mgnify:CR=1 FL=1